MKKPYTIPQLKWLAANDLPIINVSGTVDGPTTQDAEEQDPVPFGLDGAEI